MLRQASSAMENSILVLLTTGILMVLTSGIGSILEPSDAALQSTVPLALLLASMGRVLPNCALVTNSCCRVSPFVTAFSAESDSIQLSDRFQLVQFIDNIRAGFYVQEVKVTAGAAMKLMYAGCMVMATIFTKAATES